MNDCILVVIFDKVSGLYTTPIAFTNINCAVRYFKNQMSKNDNPTDYELWQCGVFDCETGVVVSFDKLELVCRGEVNYE